VAVLNVTPTVCRSWGEITKAFDAFPVPKLSWDAEGEVERETWIFRGERTKYRYPLQPSVEREADGTRLGWNALEAEMLAEFQKKARMHISPDHLPQMEDKLSWLALAQHDGVPTRLLDFTYSPYVGLYFALRNRTRQEKERPPEVWAIDQAALFQVGVKFSQDADAEVRRAEAKPKPQGVPTRFFNPTYFATQQDILHMEGEYSTNLLAKGLDPDPIRRGVFNKDGLVLSALPPVENRRLSSQQGTFLFNAAESLTFRKSLSKMMRGRNGWYRRFEFVEDALVDAEARLFQMNINDLSLFPDIEGVAGYVRQNARLLWGENA
jgi:hypothetical protein